MSPAYPLIDFGLQIGQWDHIGEALPDTGFSGDLLVPFGVGDEIIRPFHIAELRLPNRRVYEARAWNGHLMLEERVFAIEICSFGDDYVIGRGVMDKLEICFCFGERVRLNFERPAEMVQ